jgi:predicted AAA+ superfamily ATPase
MPKKPQKKEVESRLDRTLSNRLDDGLDLIQVILGPRQVGKTSAILKYLERYKGASHYVSAESAISPTKNWLDEVWQTAVEKSSKCLLVIDEIHKIEDWSERIKSLWDSQQRLKSTQLRVVLLGSSSLVIQKGLTESLTGRFELIRAYHWSLVDTHKLKKMSVTDYLRYGGYPGALKLIADKERFFDYIQNSIINTVVEKDILSQARVRNPALFRQTFMLLRSLPAAEISYTKLLGQLQDKGNTDLIKGYLEMYEGAFLITQIFKFSNNQFRSKVSTPKIVCMAPVLLDQTKMDDPAFLGLAFESLVGANLVGAGLKTYYWRDGDCELDFVVTIGNQIFGIEVKTKKIKSSKSIGEFQKHYPNSRIVFVSMDNYAKFAIDPAKFLKSL